VPSAKVLENKKAVVAALTERLKNAMLVVSTGRGILVVEVVSVDAYLLHPPFFKGCGIIVADYLIRVGSTEVPRPILALYHNASSFFSKRSS